MVPTAARIVDRKLGFVKDFIDQIRAGRDDLQESLKEVKQARDLVRQEMAEGAVVKAWQTADKAVRGADEMEGRGYGIRRAMTLLQESFESLVMEKEEEEDE